MGFKIGKINSLVVIRKTDIGYMLKNEFGDEIFMHNNELTEEINVNDDVDGFVFFDSKKRITATMKIPIISVGNPGFVTVKNVVSDLGVFIENNISKDPLISSDDLPKYIENWPKENDTVFAKLKDTGTQLIAKLVSSEELKDILIPKTKLEKSTKVNAMVIKNGLQGLNLITKEGHSLFVYYKNKRREYRIGEEVSVTIINVKDDDTYNGTLLEQKIQMMDIDASAILDYIKDSDGYIPFNTKSSIDDIDETFNMSKAAFKRALGNLYKKRLIEIKEDGTYLVK